MNNSRSFRLFGQPFEVRSSFSRDKAKAALRRQKLGWFNPKVGPRGWILGSLLCLQWSALYDRGAAVAVARIAEDRLGSRVHGRAGIDLASASLIAVIAGVVIFSIYSLLTEHSAAILLFDVAVLLIPGAVLWLRLVSPEDPEPLVRFIRHALERPTVRSTQVSTSHFDGTPVQSAKLNVTGDVSGAPPSERDVAQAILALKPEDFLIIDFGSNNFMQTALEYDRFILEKCEGSGGELYRAKGDFDRNDIIAVMTAYLRRSEASKRVVWEKERG